MPDKHWYKEFLYRSIKAMTSEVPLPQRGAAQAHDTPAPTARPTEERPSNSNGASQRTEMQSESRSIQTPSARSSHPTQTDISQDRVSQARKEAEQLNQRNKQSLIKDNNRRGDPQQSAMTTEQISVGPSTSSAVERPAFAWRWSYMDSHERRECLCWLARDGERRC